jgi:hypothetical protein
MIGTLSYEIGASIIIALGSGLLFLFLGHYFLKRKEISAEYERYKKAKETVIDVLESSLINKQPISPERIKHLISAAEREQNIALIDSPKNLVEDLELRVERSKHLDTEQQRHYIDQVEEMITKIERESIISSVPLSHQEILISLKENIEAEKKDDALKGLEKLSTKINELSERRQKNKLLPQWEVLTAAAAIVATIAFFVTILLGVYTPMPTSTQIPVQTPTPLYLPHTQPPTNNPPTAFVDSIKPNPARQEQYVTFSCHGDDPDSGDYITGYRWESSIDGFLSNQRSFYISSLSLGSHQIILRVKDSHGRWSSEITRNLRVEAIEIPSTEIDDTTPEPSITSMATLTPTSTSTPTSTVDLGEI